MSRTTNNEVSTNPMFGMLNVMVLPSIAPSVEPKTHQKWLSMLMCKIVLVLYCSFLGKVLMMEKVSSVSENKRYKRFRVRCLRYMSKV